MSDSIQMENGILHFVIKQIWSFDEADNKFSMEFMHEEKSRVTLIVLRTLLSEFFWIEFSFHYNWVQSISSADERTISISVLWTSTDTMSWRTRYDSTRMNIFYKGCTLRRRKSTDSLWQVSFHPGTNKESSLAIWSAADFPNCQTWHTVARLTIRWSNRSVSTSSIMPASSSICDTGIVTVYSTSLSWMCSSDVGITFKTYSSFWRTDTWTCRSMIGFDLSVVTTSSARDTCISVRLRTRSVLRSAYFFRFSWLSGTHGFPYDSVLAPVCPLQNSQDFSIIRRSSFPA